MTNFGVLWFSLSIFTHFLIISIALPTCLAFQWEDEDSVIIEALTPDSILKRRGGKFPFTWPWQSQGFSGRGRADNVDHDFTCYTTVGEEGVCATLKECYPMLYSIEFENERQDAENSNLIETLKSISGPCDMPSFNKFRIDMPDSVICCPSRIVHQEPGTRIPLSTTTSTTQRTTRKPNSEHSDDAVASDMNQSESSLKPTKKPSRTTPVPDAVAAPYHHEYSCGFINQSARVGMKQEEADNRFPWIVALVGSRGHFCAGSLIDRYNVLTSASCTAHMNSIDVSNLQVYLGDYKLHTISDGPLIARKVARVIYHRGFDNQTLKNDIALLRFKLPAPVGTPRVLPVCLPKKTFKRRKAELEQNMLVGVEAILAGWGRSWNPSPIPVLQKAKMTIWSNEDCRIKYGYLARSGITDHMLCAYPRRDDGFVQDDGSDIVDMDTEMMSSSKEFLNSTNDKQVKVTSGADTNGSTTPLEVQDCVGDSGGPLIMMNEDKKYEQIGIVSWNIGCSHYPYIHTRVGSYLNWIEKNRHR